MGSDPDDSSSDELIKPDSPRDLDATGWDEKNRSRAKVLNKVIFIHALYGGLDGLSLSYSMTKYSFDILLTDNALSSSDLMHDWMITPAGIALSALQAVSMIAFSLMANIFNDDDKNAFKRYISIVWPYARDSMKGLKNAYKGVRSTAQALGMLSGQNLNFLMVPVGLFFGAMSVLNRICMRKYVVEPRKLMMASNAALLLEIQSACRFYQIDDMPEDTSSYTNSYIWCQGVLCYVDSEGKCTTLSPHDVAGFKECLAKIDPKKSSDPNYKPTPCLYLSEEDTEQLITAYTGHVPTPVACDTYRKRIACQSHRLERMALVGAAYGGIVDGLYLYMGVMAVTALVPPVFIAMTIFSLLFSVTCIATRVYEEYDYQRRLKGTQSKIELVLCGKELEDIFFRWQKAFSKEDEGAPLESALIKESLSLEELERQFGEKEKRFIQIRESLKSQVTLTYRSAALAGLKNGLAAYSALATFMFAVATILIMASAPFPPAFLIACVVTGMACLMGFLSHALITNYKHQRQLNANSTKSNGNWDKFLMGLKGKRMEVQALKPTEIKKEICQGMVVDPSPQFFFQEWFEVIRSFFSGFSKGQKSVDYTLNPLQKTDSHGHYHDTKVMIWIAAITTFIYSIGLALRAYAKGLSRDPVYNDLIKREPNKKKKISSKDSSSDKSEGMDVLNKPVSMLLPVEEVPEDLDDVEDGDSICAVRRAQSAIGPSASPVSTSPDTPGNWSPRCFQSSVAPGGTRLRVSTSNGNFEQLKDPKQTRSFSPSPNI